MNTRIIILLIVVLSSSCSPNSTVPGSSSTSTSTSSSTQPSSSSNTNGTASSQSNVSVTNASVTPTLLNAVPDASSGTTSFIFSPPSGQTYNQITLAFGLVASNICAGKGIFGMNGISDICGINTGVLLSNAFRNIGASQKTQAQESVTYAGKTLPTPYNDVPDATQEFNDTPITAAQIAASVNCGSTQTTIAARIADCASSSNNGSNALWNSVTNGSAGESNWNMVTHMGGTGSGIEVWQDQRTQLLWMVDANPLLVNWCQAAGNTQNAGGVDCSANKISVCAEVAGMVSPASYTIDGTTVETPITGPYARERGGMGLASTPAVLWSLPTNQEFNTGQIDGWMSIESSTNHYWTASLCSADRSQAIVSFGPLSRIIRNISRALSSTNSVVCVGRVLGTSP